MAKNSNIEEMKKLIYEMATALETCDSANRSKMEWSQESPFQNKIEELLFRAGWRKMPPNKIKDEIWSQLNTENLPFYNTQVRIQFC